MSSRRIREELKENYRMVQRPNVPLEEDEIRISSQGRVPRYVAYAIGLLNDQQKPKVMIKATGSAIASAITIVEILKRRVPMLHQCTTIGTAKSVDVYEPIVEGLNQVTAERDVPCIEIILSKSSNQLDVSSPGYQEPLDQSLLYNQSNQGASAPPGSTIPQDDYHRPAYREKRYRGLYRGRGGRFNNYNEGRGGRGSYRGSNRQYMNTKPALS